MGSSFPLGIRVAGDGLLVEKGKNVPETVPLPWDSTRLLSIRMEEGSRATVFLTLPPGTEGERSLDVTLEVQSSLTLIVLASGLGRAKVTQRITVGEGAECRLLNVTLGGKNVEQEVAATVEGAGGTSRVDWVFRATGEDVQKLSVRNALLARDGGGDVTIRGIAEGCAEVRCDGMMEIGEGGGGTTASLTQHVLMLDATAKVDAVPGLRIKTDDVKAGHTATVTKVSEEELFYFASRGIPRQEARRMYIRGFLGGLLEKVEEAKVRDVLEREMEK